MYNFFFILSMQSWLFPANIEETWYLGDLCNMEGEGDENINFQWFSKTLKTNLIFLYQCSVFWRAKLFKSDVNFCRPWLESLDNPEKQIFLDYREYQIRRQGFLEAGCDGTRSSPSALHFVPRCLQSALLLCPKLRYGAEKLINSTLFTAGGNN